MTKALHWLFVSADICAAEKSRGWKYLCKENIQSSISWGIYSAMAEIEVFMRV